MRLNNNLYDALTGLPTLPAVAEDVRKLLGDAGALDVLYMDLGRSGQREAEIGWEEQCALASDRMKTLERLNPAPGTTTTNGVWSAITQERCPRWPLC